MIDQMRDMILDLQRRVAALEAELSALHSPQFIVDPHTTDPDMTEVIDKLQQPDPPANGE